MRTVQNLRSNMKITCLRLPKWYTVNVKVIQRNADGSGVYHDPPIHTSSCHSMPFWIYHQAKTCQLRGETKKTWLLRHQCHPEKYPWQTVGLIGLMLVDAGIRPGSRILTEQRGWVVAYILVCLYEYDSMWCCWNLNEFGLGMSTIISMHKILHQLGRSLSLYPQGYQGSV